MKDWKPPLPIDRWYAHLIRPLLRFNSRRRAKAKRDKAKKIEETNESK